jgi:CubicO group peptidase (beta-lactamase class C family)
LKDLASKLATLPLMHEPGEQFTYGVNTDLVGYLIEVISGEPLDQYFRRHILDPLGMDETWFYLPDDLKSRLVPLYEKKSADAALQLSNNEANRDYPVAGAQTYFSGGAGLIGPIEDYAKFCQMLLNGGTFNGVRLLSPLTIELMTRNQIGELDVWDRGDKFGLGFQLITEKSLSSQPGSITAFKWGGMYATDYFIDPENELIFLCYTNVHPFYYYDELFQRFRILTYQALVQP